MARARLYIESQVNISQQAQMSNLLDTVPDHVLICTKNNCQDAGKEVHSLKVLYANRMSKEFFGKDIVSKKDEKSTIKYNFNSDGDMQVGVSNAKGLSNNSKEKIKKAIFTDLDVDGGFDDAIFDQD